MLGPLLRVVFVFNGLLDLLPLGFLPLLGYAKVIGTDRRTASDAFAAFCATNGS